MDKQDAIDLIIQAYEGGKSPSEITASLAEQLGAPISVVTGFVHRTLEQRIAFLEPPTQPSADEKPAPYDVFKPRREPVAEPVPESHPPAVFPDKASAAIAALPETPPALDRPVVTVSSEVDPRLEKYILDALAKDRKMSDVVMSVCERAGLDWQEAQRLVARVNARHRKKIASRRNRFIIPLSLGAIAVGLGLTYAGIQEIMTLAPSMQAYAEGGANAALRALPAEFMRNSFWALGIGSALMIGGALGLVNALRSQLD